MNSKLKHFVVGGLLVLGGFIFGRVYQHQKTGYHLQVLAQKEFPSDIGQVHWRCYVESIGFSFLDPEITSLEIMGRTIYKARRAFQEKTPSAANVRISGNQIDWDDGELAYHLVITNLHVK